MTDRYTSFANSGPGHAIVKRLGLPEPTRLRRYRPGQPLLDGPLVLGGKGRLAPVVTELFGRAVVDAADTGTAGALVFDATAIGAVDDLRELYDFFHPLARSLRPCGRVLVLGTPPAQCASVEESVAQRALTGFVRSVAKEFGRGITAQLVYVAPGAEADVESTLRFLLSARSAYVSGQVISISLAHNSTVEDWEHPLRGQVALVTGAARGIGAAIAQELSRQGARVVCLDVPAAGDALAAVANAVGGEALQLDLTTPAAPRTLVDYLTARHNGVQIVVHNAGITRDKTLARMTEDQWTAVLEINLAAQLRTTAALSEIMKPGGRIVSVSSVNGIAGARGQTNYAASKAGVIGFVEAYAKAFAKRDITVNAVAPGFIETAMTAAMPLVIREAGRRMNSLAQGGQPVDVAEAVAWLASPASGGVTGNVVRVCGQSIVGA